MNALEQRAGDHNPAVISCTLYLSDSYLSHALVCRCLIDTGNEQDNYANSKVLEWHGAASLETGGKATSFKDTGKTAKESCVVCSPISDYCVDCSNKATMLFAFDLSMHDEINETQFPITCRFIHMQSKHYDITQNPS